MGSATLRWLSTEEATCSNYRTDQYSSLNDAKADCILDSTCGGITENNVDFGSGYYLCNYGTFYDYPYVARGLPQMNVYKKGKRNKYWHTFDALWLKTTDCKKNAIRE